MLLSYPVPPVTAHPIGEVPIIVLVIVRNKRGKQPKRQLGNRCVELSVRLLSPAKKKRTRLQPANDDPAGSDEAAAAAADVVLELLRNSFVEGNVRSRLQTV